MSGGGARGSGMVSSKGVAAESLASGAGAYGNSVVSFKGVAAASLSGDAQAKVLPKGAGAQVVAALVAIANESFVVKGFRFGPGQCK